MTIIILVTIFSILTLGAAGAVEDSFSVDLSMPQTVISRTEPIYVQWMVKNDGGNALPLFKIANPVSVKWLVSYRLWLTSIHVNGRAVDSTIAGTLSDRAGTLSTSAREGVPPHSEVCIWEMNLRSIFGSRIPSTLAPGLYRVSVDGSWEEVTTEGQTTRFWAQIYFMVR